MHSVVPYMTATLLLELPMMFLFALAELLPAFAIAAWPWSTFGYFLLIQTGGLWTCECVSQLTAVAPHFLIGMVNYQGYWFTCLMMAGIVVRPQDVVWPIRTLFYVLPFFHQFRALAKLALYAHDMPEFTGTVPCNASVPPCGPVGYACPDSGICWGRTGPEIAISAHVSYDAIDPDANVAVSATLMLLIGVAFKLLHTAHLVVHCGK